MDNLPFDSLSDGEYYDPLERQTARRLTIINLAVTVGIMALVTLLSFFFRYIGFHESNIIVAYILGVLLVATQTDDYFYGILASVIIHYRIRYLNLRQP